QLYEQKKYSEAMRAWQIAAAQDNASAQTKLGVMYANGFGVATDHKEAITWFLKAAGQNYAPAQYYMGRATQDGERRDYAGALSWYRRAAEQNYAPAKHAVGNMYFNGFGMKRDYEAA